ncbi:hypothetical protein BKA62DRAFT_780212 [Auriculariales sp. MPI-PUGE-AT-0066]|nr:hypothetical protein BKA62DRAFT_780212 [Auriculariales sp. MPI-PUGE-AT-0066]
MSPVPIEICHVSATLHTATDGLLRRTAAPTDPQEEEDAEDWLDEHLGAFLNPVLNLTPHTLPPICTTDGYRIKYPDFEDIEGWMDTRWGAYNARPLDLLSYENALTRQIPKNCAGTKTRLAQVARTFLRDAPPHFPLPTAKTSNQTLEEDDILVLHRTQPSYSLEMWTLSVFSNT